MTKEILILMRNDCYFLDPCVLITEFKDQNIEDITY